MKSWTWLLVIIHPIHGEWIDIDTPQNKRTTKSFIDGTTYELIMSDEFNVPNRSFTDGHDPMWTALDKPDDDINENGSGALHYYKSSQITTKNGKLHIQTKKGETSWQYYDRQEKKYQTETKQFESGMLQSWNKFCFTGGIVELDMILPGRPNTGGLWPAAWLLGNLGRATYLPSTNMIWPWSYNECNRKYQQPQSISACNVRNHFGLNPNQGRGATEIDIIEMVTGVPEPLPDSDIMYPYADFTLQVAPGIPRDRPQSGFPPKTQITKERNGHPTGEEGQKWYQGLEFHGNTSMNTFFYGTFMDATEPKEPVQRSQSQTFQSDSVGAMHQLTNEHFNTLHSFRIEWQPGPGGRLDWFSKAYRVDDSTEESIEGDGKGTDWVKLYSIEGESLEELVGTQIPNEPTTLILNTAISPAWGFPFTIPDWCTKKCYDCEDPACACNYQPGFCNMMKDEGVDFVIDFVRVYQSKNDTAHVGNPHTLGCDLAEYPSREYINGYADRYTRAIPFRSPGEKPLMKVVKGGGKCNSDNDCGSQGTLSSDISSSSSSRNRHLESDDLLYTGGRGKCVLGEDFLDDIHNDDDDDALESEYKKKIDVNDRVCQCNPGFTGPYCLAVAHKEEFPGIFELSRPTSLFKVISKPYIPPLFMGILFVLLIMLISVTIRQVKEKNRERANSSKPDEALTTKDQQHPQQQPGLQRPKFVQTGSNLMVTGRSV